VNLKDALSSLEITREQLIDIAILVGTDFNDGISGIGPKRALKLIKQHKNLEQVLKEKELAIDNYKEVRKIFLTPDVTDEYEISLGKIDVEKIVKMLVDEYDFSEGRVRSALDKVGNIRKEEVQRKLDDWS